MSKLKRLETKKLLRELEYIESDYDYKNEVISEADGDFLNSVNAFLTSHPELKEMFDKKINDKIDQMIKKKEEDVKDIERREMESETDGLLFVPNRRVDIVNNRDGSLRSCHYSLTDAEVNTLQNDDRVYSVEIPPEQRTDIQIGIRARQSGSFNKPSNSRVSILNLQPIHQENQQKAH